MAKLKKKKKTQRSPNLRVLTRGKEGRKHRKINETGKKTSAEKQDQQDKAPPVLPVKNHSVRTSETQRAPKPCQKRRKRRNTSTPKIEEKTTEPEKEPT